MDAITRLSEIRDKITHLDVLMWSRNGDISQFRDYIENHELPMILVGEDTTVIYCNKAMSNFVGIPLHEIIGKERTMNWYANKNEWRQLCDVMNKEGKIRGMQAEIKTVHGNRLVLIYSSVHREEGKWINSRCLFVPIDSISSKI